MYLSVLILILLLCLSLSLQYIIWASNSTTTKHTHTHTHSHTQTPNTPTHTQTHIHPPNPIHLSHTHTNTTHLSRSVSLQYTEYAMTPEGPVWSGARQERVTNRVDTSTARRVFGMDGSFFASVNSAPGWKGGYSEGVVGRGMSNVRDGWGRGAKRRKNKNEKAKNKQKQNARRWRSWCCHGYSER